MRFSVAQEFYVLSKSLRGQFAQYALATVLVLMLAFEASAQLQVGASEAGIQVQGLTTGVPAGIDGSFEVGFDDVTVPIENIVGFQLELKLDPGLDSLIQLRFAGSCLPVADQGEVSWTYNASKHSISVSLQGATSFSGEGRLFMLDVFAPTGLAIHDSMVRLGGGFILVEDIGFKMAGSVHKSSWKEPLVYPTHCRGTLYFDWQGQTPTEVALVDVRGTQAAKVPERAVQRGSWATQRLKGGLYKVVIGYGNGRRVVRSVWVE